MSKVPNQRPDSQGYTDPCPYCCGDNILPGGPTLLGLKQARVLSTNNCGDGVMINSKKVWIALFPHYKEIVPSAVDILIACVYLDNSEFTPSCEPSLIANHPDKDVAVRYRNNAAYVTYMSDGDTNVFRNIDFSNYKNEIDIIQNKTNVWLGTFKTENIKWVKETYGSSSISLAFNFVDDNVIDVITRDILSTISMKPLSVKQTPTLEKDIFNALKSYKDMVSLIGTFDYIIDIRDIYNKEKLMSFLSAENIFLTQKTGGLWETWLKRKKMVNQFF